jgi:hypothetical protein
VGLFSHEETRAWQCDASLLPGSVLAFGVIAAYSAEKNRDIRSESRPAHASWLSISAAHRPSTRQGLLRRLRPELPEDIPQGADARREREFIALNDVAKLSDEGGGFVVG